MALTEAQAQELEQLTQKEYELSARASAPNPEGSYAGNDEKRKAFEKQRQIYQTQLAEVKAQADALRAQATQEQRSVLESGAGRSQFQAEAGAVGLWGGNVTEQGQYHYSSNPTEKADQENFAKISSYYNYASSKSITDFFLNKTIDETQLAAEDESNREKLFGGDYSRKELRGFGRSAKTYNNTSIDYESTLAARAAGLNVGSGIVRNLPETYQKDWDKQFGERNKIISLTESLGGPKPKTQTEYYVGLTEGGKTTKAYTVNLEEGGAQAARSKELAVSLSEGAPKKPRELTEAQVAKMSEREYAVYASEFAPYNEWVKQQNETARVAGLANWKEFKGDVKADVADLKKQGVKFVTIKSDSGYETVPIDKAVNRIVRGKNVTSIAPVPEIPKGFTVAGSPQELVLVEEDPRKYAGPDQAYTGEFKDPRKGTQPQGLFERAAGAGAALYGAAAQTGVAVMSGLVGASKSVKSFADEITGNVTITNQTIPVIPPTDLEQTTVSEPVSAPLSASTPTQTSSQKAVAAMGGMSPQERNVVTLRQSLDQIIAASNRREAVRMGEDPFMFAVKEQKRQSPTQNYLDVREGVTTGLTYFGETAFVLPEALYEFGKSGGDSKAGEAVFEKKIAELQKGGLGPSVIGSAMSGQGTGRSPYYNIGEGIGEVIPMFLPTRSGSPKIQSPLSATTKAKLLTKVTASKEGNVYGIEVIKPRSKATNFITEKIESVKQKFRKPNQFIGSIGTEEARTQFNPLTKEAVGKSVVPEPAPTFGIGAKGEKVKQNTAKETIITSKGKPSDTPALIIDTGKGGLTGVVRATPRETLENQMGIIVRGDVTPANMKRLGLKQVSTDDKGVPVFAARLPKGAKKKEKFLSLLSEAEELGFIKRVTDIDFIPTERALGIAKGKIGKGYGPTQLKNEFQTAPYYETTASMGTPRELRIKGTTEGVTIDKAFQSGKIPKGKPRLEDEFGLTGFDAGLKESGLSAALKPKAEKGMKKFEDFSKPIEQGKGGAGRGGKLEPISQEKALNIAQNIKPLTQGVKTTEAPIRPEYGTAYTGASSAYDFETEVTGKYSISPIGATEPRIDIRVRDVFDTKTSVGLVQRDLIAEGSKQVQPTITQNLIRTDAITKSGLKEEEKQKNRLLDKLVFRNEAKQTPRTATRLQTGQQLKQTPIQKPITELVPKIPPEFPPVRPPRFPTFKIPEIEKRKTKREKEEKKEAIPFIGNVYEEQVTGGFKEFDIKYGQKKVSKQSALGLSITRKGREKFTTARTESILSQRGNVFTEKKPKKIGRDGFAKPGKKFSW